MSNYISLQPIGIGEWAFVVLGAGSRMDADAEQLAWKFYADRTSPITEIDAFVNITGTITDTNFVFEIQTDSSDTPSGSVLGAATAEWAGPATDTWTGLKALATNTGNLVVGTPYWLVLRRSSGGSLSASDNIHFQSSGFRFDRDKVRHHNGTNWTTTAASTIRPVIILKHNNGSFFGNCVTAVVTATTKNDIFGTNRQGLRIKVGAQKKIVVAKFQISKVGSPSALECVIYEGSTEKYSMSIPAADITTADELSFFFASAILLAANTNLYIIFRQASDGGDNSNDYDIRTFAVESTYIGAMVPTDWRMVFGTGNDPTALTVVTDEIPKIFVGVGDPATDFDEAAGGGSGIALSGVKVVHPGTIVVH